MELKNKALVVTSGSRRQRKQERKWSNTEDRLMVKMIEERETIWNWSSAEYKNKDAKNKCWTEIAKKTGHSVADCKIRWNAIKSRYNTERKKEKMSKNGPVVSTYNSKFKLFKFMQFLVKTESVISDETETNLIFEIQDESTTSLQELRWDSSPTCNIEDIAPQNKRKRTISHSVAESSDRGQLMNEITGFIGSQRQISEKSKWKRAFSEYVFYELERYDDRNAQNLKYQINSVCLNFKPQSNSRGTIESTAYYSAVKRESNV